MDRLWYIMTESTGEKRNRLLTHAITWINLKGIMLSKRNLISKGYKVYDCLHKTFLKDKTIVIENKSVLDRIEVWYNYIKIYSGKFHRGK